jgi:hypothetical protein
MEFRRWFENVHITFNWPQLWDSTCKIHIFRIDQPMEWNVVDVGLRWTDEVQPVLVFDTDEQLPPRKEWFFDVAGRRSFRRSVEEI